MYNYSWPLFPYIWNEVKFNIAYDSDFEFVAQTMQRVAEEEPGEAMILALDLRGLGDRESEMELHEKPPT